jgi:hypothetical protein
MPKSVKTLGISSILACRRCFATLLSLALVFAGIISSLDLETCRIRVPKIVDFENLRIRDALRELQIDAGYCTASQSYHDDTDSGKKWQRYPI